MNGEENGNPLQYSCLENAMDGGATVRYHITPTRMDITVKKLGCWQGEEIGIPEHRWWEYKMF